MWAEVFGGRGGGDPYEDTVRKSFVDISVWGMPVSHPGGIVTRMLGRNSPRAEGR